MANKVKYDRFIVSINVYVSRYIDHVTNLPLFANLGSTSEIGKYPNGIVCLFFYMIIIKVGDQNTIINLNCRLLT